MTPCISVLLLFLTMLRVGLLCVIVVFPDHTHFFLDFIQYEIHNGLKLGILCELPASNSLTLNNIDLLNMLQSI